MDKIIKEAAELCIEKDKAMCGMLQRHFRIGYLKAFEIMQELEKLGVVECGKVKITKEEWEKMKDE